MSTHPALAAHLIPDDDLRALLDGDAHPPCCVGIQAPGGYGKSTVLRRLAMTYRSAGLTVIDRWHDTEASAGPDTALLVDDAHLLDEAQLRELRHIAEARRCRLAVAYRPWPRPDALAHLIETLRQHTPPLILQPFTQDQTMSYLETTFGVEAPPAMARFVHTQTGGVPRFVDRLARAVGGLGGTVPNGRPLEVSRSMLHQFAAHLDDVDADVRRVLLIAAAGVDLPGDVFGSLLSRAPDEVEETLAAARATGLLGPDNRMPPIVRRAVASLTPAGTRDSTWHATAAALSGDLDTALRLADKLIGAADCPERTQAAMVAATALAHRGQLGRSAELYRWSGTPAATAFAAITFAATGHAEELNQLLHQPPAGAAPTLLSGASMLMARGMHETLSGSPTAALTAFVQACAQLEPAGQAELLPDSPAAVAALIGLHCGELDIAETMLERAVAARTGAALMATRHPLLHAWILMTRGNTAAAMEKLSPVAPRAVEPRDLLFAAALEVAIARRNSDLAALRQAWTRAREAILRHPVDLFTLLPFGELAIAAARLGESSRLSLQLHEAQLLLDKLGNPALWATPLHWSLLHGAIIQEDLPAAHEHVAALAAARHTRYGAAVAAGGESWLEVLRGTVDAVKVEAAARGLHGIGLCWDGARLAGQAAIRTSDRRAMTGLLDCARMLQGRPTGPAADALAQPEEGRLSEREQEVAELVLAGMTYKQIGDQLFISAKTVEHHVARMRQRLNCASRSELLNRLRTMATTRTRHPQLNLPRPPSPSSSNAASASRSNI